MRLSVSLFVSALVAAVAASNVVELTPENFDSVIGKGKPALVEFFAPWCGHCKNLAPTYEELADVFAHAKDRVVIAKVDADGAGRSLGAKYGVKGFPTLKWFDEVGKDVEEYKGGRELETLAEYVTKQSGVKSKIPEPPPPAYTVLHENNWDEIVNDPTKHVLVSFTVDAPWCRDCKDAKINWDRAAQWFQSDNVVLANVNLDEPRNGRFTSMYNIMVYPTIKFFPKGNKSGENIEYEKLKTDKDVVTFLNNRAGTNRLVGGKLNLVAGRIPELDEVAEKFVTAKKAARLQLLEEAKEIAAKLTNKPTAAQYIKIMEKVTGGASGYVEKERKRLKVIASKAIDLKKQDEVKMKDNILRVFQTKTARDKYDL